MNTLVVPGSDIFLSSGAGDVNLSGQMLAWGRNMEGDSITALLTPIDPSPADLDGDCDTDADDLLALLEDWGQSQSPADFDHSGAVGFADLLFLLSNWT